MSSDNRLRIKTGATVASDAKVAAGELFDMINQRDMEAVIFFCSSHYDLETLGVELQKTFPCQLIGCTSSGEISSAGYQDGGMVGVSIASSELKMHPHLLAPLRGFGITEAQNLAETVRRELTFSRALDSASCFGMLLVDGLSIMEEQIVATLSNHFEGISITGGSAGDDMRFHKTAVYHEGRFHSGAALFTICETTLPFHVFQTQHFSPSDKKLVITEADPARRLVTEINAEPAALAFAELLGLQASDLGPEVFSKYPLMLRIGDQWFVRSIQSANKDGSLSFYCAIDVGLVLTIGEGNDMTGSLMESLKAICRDFNRVDLVIGFDCILRKLEMREKRLQPDIENLLHKLNFIGFNTYGEQYNSIHVNQTMTGVVIGG